jgi:hypothetical protein
VLGFGHENEGLEEFLIQADGERVSRTWFHSDTYFPLDKAGGSC